MGDVFISGLTFKWKADNEEIHVKSERFGFKSSHGPCGLAAEGSSSGTGCSCPAWGKMLLPWMGSGCLWHSLSNSLSINPLSPVS